MERVGTMGRYEIRGAGSPGGGGYGPGEEYAAGIRGGGSVGTGDEGRRWEMERGGDRWRIERGLQEMADRPGVGRWIMIDEGLVGHDLMSQCVLTGKWGSQ